MQPSSSGGNMRRRLPLRAGYDDGAEWFCLRRWALGDRRGTVSAEFQASLRGAVAAQSIMLTDAGSVMMDVLHLSRHRPRSAPDHRVFLRRDRAKSGSRARLSQARVRHS